MHRHAFAVGLMLLVLAAGCLMQAPSGPEPEDDASDAAVTAPRAGNDSPSDGSTMGGEGSTVTAAGANGTGGAGNGSPATPPYRVRVRAVTSADVLAVTLPNGTNASVRLLGVDAPGPGGADPASFQGVPATPGGRNCLAAWGERADGFVERALPSSVTVRLDPSVSARDGRGRIRGYVAYDGTVLNRKLVTDGYARAVSGSYANASAYAAAEDAARGDTRRLWNCRHPPARYRGEASGSGGVETGSASGMTAADAECSDYQTRTAAQEAYEAGETELDADGDGIACEGLGG